MTIWVLGTSTNAAVLDKLCEQARALADESSGELVRVDFETLETLAERAELEKPDVILAASNEETNSVLSRLAVRLHTGLSVDCLGAKFAEDSGKVHWIRPVYDNSLLAEMVNLGGLPQIGSLRITIQDPSLTWDEDMPIDDAEIVVCVGRGCGNGEGIALAKELARELGAAVGATRAVTDAGWLPISKQIGQTGKYIRPRVYIGVGVAGAIQHLAGMRNSDIIIAINRDARAPIFEYADYGIVGDLFEVLPNLIAGFKCKV